MEVRGQTVGNGDQGSVTVGIDRDVGAAMGRELFDDLELALDPLVQL